MKQVLIRRKLAGGNTVLYPADVLSETATAVRVKVKDELKPRTVNPSEVINVRQLSGNQPIVGNVIPIAYKQHPERNTLYGLLNK